MLKCEQASEFPGGPGTAHPPPNPRFSRSGAAPENLGCQALPGMRMLWSGRHHGTDRSRPQPSAVPPPPAPSSAGPSPRPCSPGGWPEFLLHPQVDFETPDGPLLLRPVTLGGGGQRERVQSGGPWGRSPQRVALSPPALQPSPAALLREAFLSKPPRPAAASDSQPPVPEAADVPNSDSRPSLLPCP